MLLSLALIFLCGMSLGGIFQKLKLPSLLGMLLTGIILGPYVLQALDSTILNISKDLRQIALIIILTRAGLNLDIHDLKRVGRPAILMCFVPACFEILAVIAFAPPLLGITIIEAAIMGSVLAAVSPAVIVPKMLHLMEEGYGKTHSIPQMIMAGASVDDVFVIVLFTTFTSLAQGSHGWIGNFITIPSSIFFGLLVGIFAGLFLTYLFSHIHMRDSSKVLLILSIAFLFVTLESYISSMIGFSGLLAVMSMGATIQQTSNTVSKRLSNKFSKLWVCAEVLLFVLVGASVNIQYVYRAGFLSVTLIVCALCIRFIGVLVCLIKTPLTKNERLFSAIAYMPKATVQAAIGGLPLAMGLACGDIVLTIAVVSILLSAPLGAKLIDVTYQTLLTRDT